MVGFEVEMTVWKKFLLISVTNLDSLFQLKFLAGTLATQLQIAILEKT